MAFPSSPLTTPAAAEKYLSWYCALLLASLLLLCCCDIVELDQPIWRNGLINKYYKPCDEFYVVGEGETLHTISDKCGDPFILEENPHVQDPDDVFPGLIIKITP